MEFLNLQLGSTIWLIDKRQTRPPEIAPPIVIFPALPTHQKKHGCTHVQSRCSFRVTLVANNYKHGNKRIFILHAKCRKVFVFVCFLIKESLRKIKLCYMEVLLLILARQNSV